MRVVLLIILSSCLFTGRINNSAFRIVTLFTADVKGSLVELFSISAKQGHSQNIALIGCIMWTSTLAPKTRLSCSTGANGSA